MTHLQEALDNLRNNLQEMSDLVGRQMSKSLTALLEQDMDLANDVMVNEKRVNATELRIDEACEHIFALQSPVAQDMRLVFATLKINADLERIGDYAEGIAKFILSAKDEFDHKLIENLQIKNMGDTALAMLADATNAYHNDDSKLARSVFTRDAHLNEINHIATDITADYCRSNPDKIHLALHLLSIIRKLERVGDHITNIAEEVIFYVEAQVLKHKPKNDSAGD